MRVKRILIMLVFAGLLFGGVFGFVEFRNRMIAQFFASQPAPVVPVTAEPARLDHWQQLVPAVGTLRAVNGVDVAASTAGLVQSIAFQSGQRVAAGQLLVKLDADVELAQLRQAQAQLELARTSVSRARTLARSNNVPEAALDKAESELKVADAQVAALKAQIDKKSIVAPFDGVLGVRKVDVGQYLQPGAPIVTLQDLSVMLADFSISQKDLAQVAVGQTVSLTTDAWPGRRFAGVVSAIDPLVEAKSGMVRVQARLPNPDGALRPGMFAKVEVAQPARRKVVTVPQSAIAYNLYGDSVFVVEEGPEGGKTVARAMVDLGERRDGRVVVLNGIEPGRLVVTSGQMKLENGTRVTVGGDNPLAAPHQVSLQ